MRPGLHVARLERSLAEEFAIHEDKRARHVSGHTKGRRTVSRRFDFGRLRFRFGGRFAVPWPVGRRRRGRRHRRRARVRRYMDRGLHGGGLGRRLQPPGEQGAERNDYR